MAGSELGAGLVVSPGPVQLTAHPGAPSLSSLFLQSSDQSKTNPAVETISTEVSLCKPCELKKVG